MFTPNQKTIRRCFCLDAWATFALFLDLLNYHQLKRENLYHR